ncbi:PP2C family protein-serine/threonine phosphatase [Planctomycetota bacterium]
MPTPATAVRIPDSGRAQRLRVAAGACSVKGTRRDNNEDCEYISPDLDLFIVADGVGGHNSGEVASRFAVDALSHQLAQFVGPATDEEVRDRVRKALDRAHLLILDLAEGKPEYSGAATTVVLALLLNHRLYVTGVGDSRAYLIRGHSIRRLTVDDTWPDVLYHMHQISADDAKKHSMRNRLLSGLGIRDFKADKQIQVLDVYHGDRFLLASDGLTDVVDEPQLQEIISENADPQEAAEELVEKAVANGGGDDVTCVVFFVQSVLGLNAPPSRSTLWRRVKDWIGRS